MLSNNISYILIDGKQVEDNELIIEHIEDFYKALFREDQTHRTSWDHLELPQLSQDQYASLETPFTESEIWCALNDLVGEKMPGPNGFPIRCYQVLLAFY